MWSRPLRILRPPERLIRHASLRSSPWDKESRGPLRGQTYKYVQLPETTRSSSSSKNRSRESPSPSSQPSQPSSTAEALSSTLHDTAPRNNTLLAPVYIPEDPNTILKGNHPAAGILANSGLVVQRQLEMMNVLLGFEQANRYVILDAQGNHVGYMAERERGLGNLMARQWFRTHRSFVTHVFDRRQNEVLRFHRPFSWINSRIRVYDALSATSGSTDASPKGYNHGSYPGTDLVHAGSGDSARISSLGMSAMRVIGETQQQWAPLRRKYNLFLFHPVSNPDTNLGSKFLPVDKMDMSESQQIQVAKMSPYTTSGEFGQFAYVDEPFLSWDFGLRSADDRLIGSVNRDFAGFAREIFTDTGVYALRMDSAALVEESTRQHLVSQTHRNVPQAYSTHDRSKIAGMTLDQRAVMLAAAVSIDFDYFSRHSNSHGMLPIGFWGAAGEAEAAGGAAGGPVAGEAAGTAAERTAAGVAGAGTMAGYEAMRGGPAGDKEASQVSDHEEQPREFNESQWDNKDDNSHPPGQDPHSDGGDADDSWDDLF